MQSKPMQLKQEHEQSLVQTLFMNHFIPVSYLLLDVHAGLATALSCKLLYYMTISFSSPRNPPPPLSTIHDCPDAPPYLLFPIWSTSLHLPAPASTLFSQLPQAKWITRSVSSPFLYPSLLLWQFLPLQLTPPDSPHLHQILPVDAPPHAHSGGVSHCSEEALSDDRSRGWEPLSWPLGSESWLCSAPGLCRA